MLFDEIEKAHPSILDKFLQILENGRIADSAGETMYFSESLIIFTSNLGGRDERIAAIKAQAEKRINAGKEVDCEEVMEHIRTVLSGML